LQEERAARNESLFREINERLAQLNDALEEISPYGEWMCECQDVDCHEPITMTLAEYHAVREHPNRFAIAAHGAHLYPEVERVVDETDRYWVVEKLGEAATVATELDPRGDAG
jgi:hypothetical protein